MKYESNNLKCDHLYSLTQSRNLNNHLSGICPGITRVIGENGFEHDIASPSLQNKAYGLHYTLRESIYNDPIATRVAENNPLR